MIERLLIAAIVIAAIGAVSLTIRAYVASRGVRLAAGVQLAPASNATVRLLLFSAPWCGDCQTQKSVIDAERDRLGRPVEIIHHDVLAEGDFARTFGIVTVPALVVAAPDGRIAGVRHGLVEPDRLRSLIAAAG
ncbi:MAG: thioredoxin family protein [Thermomicrobiales bacterium]|nr:thioredoxin family protein [Thermomicrobiales bacterium]